MNAAAADGASPLFVSLGETCQTAYQIRRFSGRDDALLFDWLITPDDAYKSLLADDDAFFRPQNWELVERGGIRLRDKATDLRYQHEFAVLDPETHIIDADQVEAHLPTAKSKFLYLKRKTLQYIQKAPDVYLVRYERIKDWAEAIERAEDIRNHYLPLNPAIKVIVASPDLRKEIVSSDFFLCKIADSPDWSGDDASWDQMFKRVLLARR